MKNKKSVKKLYVDSRDYCEEAALETQRLINLIKSSNNKNDFIYTTNVRQADLIIYYACGHLQSKQNESIEDIKKLFHATQKNNIFVVHHSNTNCNYNVSQSV